MATSYVKRVTTRKHRICYDGKYCDIDDCLQYVPCGGTGWCDLYDEMLLTDGDKTLRCTACIEEVGE